MPEIIAKECRFALHIPAKYPDRQDAHLIKERVHFSDGTSAPMLRLLKNYKRPFWITKPSARTHTQKKEWEHLDNLIPYECTQSELSLRVAQALGEPNTHLKKLLASPYVYGADITSTTHIKKEYADRYPDKRTPYSVAAFDIETHVENGHTEIVIATIAMGDYIYSACVKSLFKDVKDREAALKAAYAEHLPDYQHYRIEVDYVNNELEVIQKVFKVAHQLRPDFLAIWNMNYDIPRILEMLKRYRVAPETIFCDPNLPPEYRYCHYRPGKQKRVTADGRVKPIGVAAQWHTLYASASFYVIDAMCVYRLLRLSKQELPNYKLDTVLRKEKIPSKLKFEVANHVTGLRWHHYMQEHYPIEYLVYNHYDCLSMLELDAKTKDLCLTLPEFAGYTDFYKFDSQPKRITDALYFHLLPQGYVLASAGYTEVKTDHGEDYALDREDEEEELNTLNLKGWIITLPAEYQVEGLPVLKNAPEIRTNIRAMVYDSDAVAAYPTCIKVLSVSKETTVRELIDISGIPEELFRMQNINLMAGAVNAIEYCTTLFKLPTPDELVARYQATQKNKA